MNIKRKLIKTGGGLILIIACALSISKLNSYLQEESLFMCAKGSDTKAFINSTWGMSIKEVERANGCKLNKDVSQIAFVFDNFEMLLGTGRIKSKESCKINIWGVNREVDYDFFDNQLFRVKIYDDILDKALIDSMVVASLEVKYGTIQRKNIEEYSGKFETDEVEVEYGQYEYNKDNKNLIRLVIKITYKPILNKMLSASKLIQNNVF
jgi:hypothetical protein